MNLAQEPAVIEWFAMLKADRNDPRRNRQGIARQDSQLAGGDTKLSNGSAHAIIAVLKDRERRHIAGKTKKTLATRPRQSGRRMREIRELKKRGTVSRLIDVQYLIVRLTSQLESVDIEEYELDDVTQEAIKAIYEDLVELQTWMDLSLAVVERRLEDAGLIAKIKHLREGHQWTHRRGDATARRLAAYNDDWMPDSRLETKGNRAVAGQRLRSPTAHAKSLAHISVEELFEVARSVAAA